MTGGLSVINAPRRSCDGPLAVPQPGELHLWYWRSGSGDCEPLTRREHLNRREREHYARLIPAKAKEEYLVAHAGLQSILGGYLGIAPGEVEWQCDPQGKPFVAGELEFNLSHSRGSCLLAVSRDPVGVDIEGVRSVSSRAALARRYLTSREQAALASLEEDESQQLFFALWTRKEAYMKLLGVGIQGQLNSVDVLSVDDGGTEVGRVDDPRRDACWLADVGVPGDFRAAVACGQRPLSTVIAQLAKS